MGMPDNGFYGWFDDAKQAAPTYDPPHDGRCLYCGRPITPDDVRTHSLMMATGYARRSYFYRTHRTCDDGKLPDEHPDDVVFAMIQRNGD